MLLKNLNAVVISHEKNATKRLFSRALFFLNNLEEKPPTTREGAEMIKFEHTNSTFYIGTAGSRAFGRGDDIHRLHCSEIAFWEKPEDLMLGIQEAMAGEDSRIVFETTARGQGNYFHKHYLDAKNGKNTYKPHFFRWFDDDEYTAQGTLDNPTKEEIDLRLAGATEAHLVWRRKKIKDTGIDGFMQEFPSDDTTCFLQSGRPIFRSEYLKIASKHINPRLLTSEEARKFKDKEFVIGVDTAEGGAKSNFCVGVVLDIETGEEVAMIRGRWTPDVFAGKLKQLAEEYNDAMIGVERNNHGHSVILKLRELGITNLFVHKDGKYGWLTNDQTKRMLIDELEEALRKEYLKIASPVILEELATMQYNDKGHAETPSGMNDDTVMAIGIAWQLRKRKAFNIENINQE